MTLSDIPVFLNFFDTWSAVYETYLVRRVKKNTRLLCKKLKQGMHCVIAQKYIALFFSLHREGTEKERPIFGEQDFNFKLIQS